jgi:hypothetical protein
VTTVVGVACFLSGLAVQQAEANALLARLVRDGGDDALPAQSALELMTAAGSLHHEAQVTAALGLAEMEQTHAHLDDGVRSAPSWCDHHTGMSSGTVAEL